MSTEKDPDRLLGERSDLIDVLPSDPDSPLQWPFKKRLATTMAYGVTTMCAQFAATILSPAIPQIAEEFNVPLEVSILAMSVYILGNSLGPMLFAPVSETFGRKIGVFIPYAISALVVMVTACLNSIASLVILRFIAGIFAAAPVVSSGAAMADMWPTEHRGAALVVYSIFIIVGATAAPIFGALLVDTGSYGWRWCCWLAGIMGFLVSVSNFIFVGETYRPIIAARKARAMRINTGQWSVHAPHDGWALTASEFFKVHCARPILMMCTPIVFLMAIFGSFAYALMFLIITSVGDNFAEVKGFTGAASYLPLLPVTIGFSCGGLANVYNSKIYGKKMGQNGGVPVPENRLLAMMALGWALPVGCFIYGWTLYPHIHWIVPCIGLSFVGLGVAVIFQNILNYLVDCYPKYGASAIAANTFLRSLFGAAFPLFTNQMYHKLGVHWASSLMGFLGLLVIPLSYSFYIFGARARKINPFEEYLS